VGRVAERPGRVRPAMADRGDLDAPHQEAGRFPAYRRDLDRVVGAAVAPAAWVACGGLPGACGLRDTVR